MLSNKLQKIADKIIANANLTNAEKTEYEANKAEIDAAVEEVRNAAPRKFVLADFVPEHMKAKTIRPNKANAFAAGTVVEVIPDFTATPSYQVIDYKDAAGEPAQLGFVVMQCDTPKGKVAVQFDDRITIEERVSYHATVENVSKNGKRHVLTVGM